MFPVVIEKELCSVAPHCFVCFRLFCYIVLVLFHEAGTVLQKYTNERINKCNINPKAAAVKGLSGAVKHSPLCRV